MLSLNYEELIYSWNNTLALIAKIVDVPVALVMKLENDKITVFSRNKNDDNPYELGDSEVFEGSGLYCENVVKNQTMLHVPNALNDPKWDSNPDIKLDMISYLGLPIVDGEDNAFGTVCLLDKEEHQFSDITVELLYSVKQNFEAQLKLLQQQHADDQRSQYQEFTTLIRGVAHEMNTPLGVGITAASVLDKKIDELTQLVTSSGLTKNKLLDTISSMRSTVALVSDNMQTAAHKLSNLQDITVNDAEVHVGEYQLDSLIKEAFVLYEKELNLSEIQCRVESDDKLGFDISIAAPLFHKVLFILFKNSIEHGFNSSTTNSIILTLKDSSENLLVDYYDNGTGLKQGILDEVFSPYYTSNKMSECSGLGLAIAKRIITQQLGGDIKAMACTSGVHFKIRLPKTNA